VSASTPPLRRDGQSVAVVHDKLREAILVGDVAPGAVMSQVALAQQLNIGRGPVREAVRLLQSEGLVHVEPNRRFRISELSGPDAEELYVLRIMVETSAVRLTVPAFTSHDIAELEGYMAQMDHYGRDEDWASLRVPHRAFHRKLTQGAGPRTMQMINELFYHGERYRLAQVAATEQQWGLRQSEHRTIVGAAARQDAERTADLLASHYARTARMVIAGSGTDHDARRLRGLLRVTFPSAEAALDAA